MQRGRASLLQALPQSVAGKWSYHLADRHPKQAKDDSPEENRTLDIFMECVRDYLEKVAGVKNLGNQVIRWLRTAKKPLGMPVDAWHQRRLELEGYLGGGWLRLTIPEANEAERSENFFLSMPKTYQQKYAERESSCGPLDEMVPVFQQYFTADKGDGTLKTLLAKQAPHRRTSPPTQLRQRQRDRRREHRSGRRPKGSRGDASRRYDSRRDRRDGRDGYRHSGRDRDGREANRRDGKGGRGSNGHKKPSDGKGGDRRHDGRDRGRENAMHVDERSRSRSRSPSVRSRSPSRSPSRSSRSRSTRRSRSSSRSSHASAYHAAQAGGVNDKFEGMVIDCDDDEPRPQDIHKSSKEGLYSTFKPPSFLRKFRGNKSSRGSK